MINYNENKNETEKQIAEIQYNQTWVQAWTQIYYI